MNGLASLERKLSLCSTVQKLWDTNQTNFYCYRDQWWGLTDQPIVNVNDHHLLPKSMIYMVKGWRFRPLSSFQSGWGGVTQVTSPIFHLICYIVQCMNIYGWGVGISSVSKLANRRGRMTLRTLPVFHLITSFVPWIYIWFNLKVGISTVSKFSNRRGGATAGTPPIFHLIYRWGSQLNKKNTHWNCSNMFTL